MRTCYTCKETKQLDEFHERQATAGGDGIATQCKDCLRDKTLQRTYGITLDEYDAIAQRQGGVCAICGELDETFRLSVDHEHDSGKIRGLLCGNCNHGLGHFKDRPDLMLAAIQYLLVFTPANIRKPGIKDSSLEPIKVPDNT